MRQKIGASNALILKNVNGQMTIYGDIQNVKKQYYVSIKYLTERKETSYGKRNEHPGTFTPRLCTS